MEAMRKWIETLIGIVTVCGGNICVVQPFQEEQWKEQNK